MTAENYPAIRCDAVDADGERCDTEWGHPTRVDTHRELRRHLKARGWARHRRDGVLLDLCPEHAAGGVL